MVQYLGEDYVVSEGATRNVLVNYTDTLDSAELLTGAVTAADDDSTGDLTFSNEAVNTGALTDRFGNTVAIGKGIQFSFSGQLKSRGRYRISFTVSSDSTPAQVLPWGIIIRVE